MTQVGRRDPWGRERDLEVGERDLKVGECDLKVGERELEGLVRAKRRRKLPVVLTAEEVKRILPRLEGEDSLALRLALRLAGYDIRTVQELLGHRSLQTTMIYTHVLNRGGRGVQSPVGRL